MTLEQHARVLDRIAAKDPGGAREAMAAHLDGVARWWRAHGEHERAAEAAQA